MFIQQTVCCEWHLMAFLEKVNSSTGFRYIFDDRMFVRYSTRHRRVQLNKIVERSALETNGIASLATSAVDSASTVADNLCEILLEQRES